MATKRTRLQISIEHGPVTTIREALILLVAAFAYRVFHGKPTRRKYSPYGYQPADNPIGAPPVGGTSAVRQRNG